MFGLMDPLATGEISAANLNQALTTLGIEKIADVDSGRTAPCSKQDFLAITCAPPSLPP